MSARVLTRWESQGANTVTGDAKKIKRGIDDVGDSGKGATSAIGGINNALTAMGGVAVAGAIVNTAFNLTMLGDSANSARVALNSLSDNQAPEYIDAIKESANGAVSELEAMRIANGFLGPGLADTAEEAAEFARIARILGANFKNLGAADAATEFQLLLSNMSIARLDSFGISANAVRIRIDELQEATPGLTREMAFMQAVMEEGAAKADTLEASAEGLTQEFGILKAEAADTAQVVGGVFATQLTPAVAGLNDAMAATEEFNAGLAEQQREIAANAGSVKEYRQGMRELIGSLNAVERSLANTRYLETTREGYARAAEEAVIFGALAESATRQAIEAAPVAAAEAENLARSQEYLAYTTQLAADASAAAQLQRDTAIDQFTEITSRLEAYNEQVDENARLTSAAQQGAVILQESYLGIGDVYTVAQQQIAGLNLSQSEQLELLNAIGLATGQVSAETIAQGDAISDLSNLLGEGRLSAEEYTAALDSIRTGADAGQVVQDAMISAANELVQASGGALDMASAMEQLQNEAAGVDEPLQNIIDDLNEIEGERNVTFAADGAAVFSVLDAIERRIRELQDLSLPGGGGDGGAAGGGTARALGGRLEEGEASIIGETGREMFIPSEDGFVVPNYQTEDLLGARQQQNTFSFGSITLPQIPPHLAESMSPQQMQRFVENAMNNVVQTAQRSASSAVGGLTIQ